MPAGEARPRLLYSEYLRETCERRRAGAARIDPYLPMSRRTAAQHKAPAHQRPPRRITPYFLGAFVLLVVVLLLAAVFGRFEYAYLPPLSKVINAERNPMPAYDVLGRSVGHEEAARLQQTPEGRASLSAAQGAIRIDAAFLEFGREAFYRETFDNEYFLSDVIGALDGPITPWAMSKALIALAGRGTDNLQVRLAEDVTIAGKAFRKGELIDTGIDVARGAFAPIGFKMSYERGRIRTGVTCAACHTKVDPESGSVLEGPPNPDINMGLILALAPNSAAYFGRTDVDLAKREDLYLDPDRTAPTGTGGRARLPDPQRLETAVDEVLMHWPPGNFDTMVDMSANPSRIPDSFTLGDHPYGWNGFGQVGPFQGLSTLGNNVHAFNADPSIEFHTAPLFFELEPETYLAVLFQNASQESVRYDPGGTETALEFLQRVGPNPDSPGMSELPDPANSLLALIDRGLRERVVTANRADPMLSRFNALGMGHEQWVDRSAGFSAKEQRALIHYLLYLDQDEDPPKPTAAESAHADGAARSRRMR